MATIASAQSGNWSVGSTWVGGVAPTAADDITVASGHTVTLDAAFIVEKTLTVNGKLDLSTYNLAIGNGTAKDGTLTLGPGAELAIGAGGLTLNNCYFLSTATSSQWAKVTGTGAITRGAVLSDPKQRIVPRYVSFQTTGAITLGSGNTSGAVVSPTLDLTNTVFVGCGTLSLGRSGYPAQAATDMIFRNVDFRDTGNITIAGYNGTITGQTVWESVTISKSSGKTNVNVIGRPGIDFKSSVFDSATWGVATPHGQGGGHDLLDCFFRQYTVRSSRGDSFAAFGATSSVKAGRMQDCYVHTNLENTHGVNAAGTGTPTETTFITGNIFDYLDINNPGWDDTGNLVIYGTPALDITKNLLIGYGNNLVGAAGAGTSPQGLTVAQNTVYCRLRNATPNVVQALMLYEYTTEGYLGTDHISSNLIWGDVPLNYGVHDNAASTTETVSYSDYNWFGNVTQPYKDVTVAGRAFEQEGPNDKVGAAATDPQFVDKTRRLATFAVLKGWAAEGQTEDEKVNAATAKLIAINGYNATTKTQSDTPSGASITELVSWVKAGFVPQNQALKGTGESGVDIGAMAVHTPAPTPSSSYGSGAKLKMMYGAYSQDRKREDAEVLMVIEKFLEVVSG